MFGRVRPIEMILFEVDTSPREQVIRPKDFVTYSSFYG